MTWPTDHEQRPKFNAFLGQLMQMNDHMRTFAQQLQTQTQQTRKRHELNFALATFFNAWIAQTNVQVVTNTNGFRRKCVFLWQINSFWHCDKSEWIGQFVFSARSDSTFACRLANFICPMCQLFLDCEKWRHWNFWNKMPHLFHLAFLRTCVTTQWCNVNAWTSFLDLRIAASFGNVMDGTKKRFWMIEHTTHHERMLPTI